MYIHTLNTMAGVFQGSGVNNNFWLYWLSTLIDLILTLMSVGMIYGTTRSLAKTYHLGGFKYPVNLYKAFILTVGALIFLRVAPDTCIQLLWKEANSTNMLILQHINQFFDTLAMVPFLTGIYILIRSGPLMEFQLLRQPIPVDLWPSWRMIRRSVYSMILITILSLLVVSTKLTL